MQPRLTFDTCRARTAIRGWGRRLAELAAAAVLALAVLASPADAGIVTRLESGVPGTALLMMAGDFVGGETARLKAEVSRLVPGQKVVLILESGGGLVDAGLELGRYIHANRLATVVVAGGKGCHSACALAFQAGRDHRTGEPLRLMVSGAKLGFHQISAKFDPQRSYSGADMAVAFEKSQQGIAAIEAYFREIGANLEFLTLLLKAPSASIALVNEFDALRLGIHVMDQSTQRLLAPGDQGRL